MSKNSDINVNSIIEALIFSSPEPVPANKLAKIAGIPREDVPAIVDNLNSNYQKNQRSFSIRQVGGGYAYYVKPDFAHWIDELLGRNRGINLTRSMFEVLAIIAVKQPTTKPVVDKIRGVNSTAPLNHLLKQGLVTIKGRASTPGKPFIYATTVKFLKVFGLNSPEDIPSFEELEKMLGDEPE
ncbi:SMC-Scp complex subunit ScpB [bacterium]|nr:MAG: SMC-Scp complex subunit ScpB [bacterium]